MRLFRWMNILNGVHAFAYVMSMLCSCIGRAKQEAVWFKAAGHLLVWSFAVPLGAIVWLAALVGYIRNCNNDEFAQRCGRKWIWLIIWPMAGTILFVNALLMLAGLSGV